MTSPANQQNPIPATNSSATTASYASAAGAPKQQSQAPVVATGSQAPVVGSSASSAQNANRTSTSPVNGKPSVTPAVPAVARGSATNGSSAHSRKSSVTMAASGPNSYVANGGPVGGAKSGIQFGFESSPAPTHSTPQTGSSAPIPIPGGASGGVPSPAASPAPIPQPSASGGPPRSGLQQPGGPMLFGSLGSDGERHMRQGSAPSNANAMGQPQPHGTHFRRESGHSVSGESQGRGGGFVPQGGRGGRGYNPQYNNQMGYPPNNQFRNGPGQGRGMPPAFQPQPRNMGYPSSPQPSRVQPSGSMPGTPNMQHANMQPGMAMQTPPQYHYPPPMGPQQVQSPSFASAPRIPMKNKKPKNHNKKSQQAARPADAARDIRGGPPRYPLREANNHPALVTVNATDNVSIPSQGSTKLSQVSTAVALNPPRFPVSIDLSPTSGQFEQLLTWRSQNYGYPPQHDNFGRPLSMQYGAYGQMPYMGGPPQANSPSFNQQFAQPAYHQASHSMSRTPSQPERPSSANQPNQPMVVSSTPQPQNSQPKPTSSSFVKPRKSAAIQIKNLAGEVVDTSSFKAPASPAPSTKTPPVAASAPTPPPKSSTPSHGRAESQQPAKTAKEIQEELRNKIKAATAEAAEESSAERKEPIAEVKAAEPVSAPKESAASGETPQAAPKEATKEAPKEPEAAPKPEEKCAKAEPEKPAETEEEEMERMIREMEEEDARREAEAEEFNKKKAAAQAAKKAEEEKNRAAKAAEEDAKLREQEREMERLEEEKERKRNEGGKTLSVAEALAAARAGKEISASDSTKVDDVADKLAGMKIDGDKAAADAKQTTAEKRGAKPQRLDLAPLNTKPVEPPQPSAALQSLKSARFLTVMGQDIYPAGISSPNPALNAAVAKKGKTFHYDANFLLQFQKVFTEKPSVEFDKQIKSLMGDGEGGRAGSARAQTPGSAREKSRGGGFQMGSFNNTALGGRTLPPGTSSNERFALSNSNGSMGRSGVNPIASFQRPGGAFPNPSSMSRTASQSGLPSSPRTSSQRTRGGSRRNNFDAKEAQAAKTMPLTAGQEVKPIAVTASGWKPTSIGNKAPAATGAGAYMEPEMVQRKVKAALNKMTPEKFDRIADQILEIASQSKDESDGRTLRQVIQLTFEKATDEAHWASMYAKFCKRMLETISPEVRDEGIKDKNGQVVSGGNLFRKYLLNRCQEEFENGWVSKKEETETTEGEADKAEGEKEAEKKLGDTTLMSDEYYAAAAQKRRGLGLVQFIGELFKLGMLTERIMHQCVHRLVDYKGVPDEAEIESLCKLLRTIGYNLDQSERGAGMMNAYFTRIQQAIDMPELPSRMKFMLMDVVDLRKAGWQSKDGNKGPKTLDEVRAEAEAAQAAKAQENARNNQRGGGRPPAGRGDARNFSAGYQQQSNNQVGLDDLRRLKGSASRTSSQNVTLGPTSMFSSRSNSGRRMGPGGSLGRPGEDSGASSRTGTPPTRENTSRSNTFGLLATMGDEDPTSPPSTAASPAVSKAVPADSDKKGGE